MSSLYKHLSTSLYLPILCGAMLLLATGGWYFRVAAQSGPPVQPVEEVRVIYPNEWSVQRPAGLAYSAALGQFFLVDRSNEEAANERSRIIALTPYEDLVESVNLNFGLDRATNIAFDDSGRRLFILNHQRNVLAQITLNANGRLVPASLARHTIPELNLTSVQAITVDSNNRFLYILDSDAGEVVRLRITNNGINKVQVQRRSVKEIVGDVPLRGLAVHPQNSHIFTLSPTEELLYELSQTGQVVARYDLAPLDFAYPEALTFAPSSDLTDAEGKMHLFITDSQAPPASNAATSDGTDNRPDGIVDLLNHHIFLPLVASFGNATSVYQPVDTPAAETTAVTAGTNANRYGEIVEIMLERRAPAPRAASVSLVTANLVQTVDLSNFSPPSPDSAGVVYLSTRNRLLISDSEVNEMPIYDGTNLFEVAFPGTLVETGTTVSYSDEPTGVGFNPSNNHLFISDDTGSDKGVYEIDPGPDGIYGNNDDTIVSHFSSEPYGSEDPEGVTYDTTTGHLFIADGVNNEVYRVNPGPGGVFGNNNDIVTSFDTEALGILDPEGIHYDPATNTLFIAGKEKTLLYQVSTTGSLLETIDISAATTERPAGVTIAPGTNDPSSNNLFLVDRGLDNDSNPNENDGKLFEFTFTALPTPTPTNTSTPPAFCTGPVLSTSIRIANSTDDAEETIASGAMSITSSDLELGGNGQEIVGVRFPGVAVPQGNTIISAYVEFEADEAWADPTTLTFRAHDVNNAATFAGTNGNISSRVTTTASVNWNNVPAWTVNGKYRSADLAPVIQEVVNRGGWNSGNALVLIITGTGLRVAEAFDGEAIAAPLLFVESCAAGAQPTATPTATATNTPVPTGTDTPAATATATATNTPAPTATDTPVATATPTATATNTPVPTATTTGTPTLTPTPSFTPTFTPTATPTTPPTATPTGTVTPLLFGDCNGDQTVDAGDLSATTLEIFDSDGNLAVDAGGGTFPGTVACDANDDTLINAGDLSCVVLLIFQGQGSCTAGSSVTATANQAILEQRIANFP